MPSLKMCPFSVNKIECHDVKEFDPLAYISGSMDTGLLFMVRYITVLVWSTEYCTKYSSTGS